MTCGAVPASSVNTRGVGSRIVALGPRGGYVVRRGLRRPWALGLGRLERARRVAMEAREGNRNIGIS